MRKLIQVLLAFVIFTMFLVPLNNGYFVKMGKGWGAYVVYLDSSNDVSIKIVDMAGVGEQLW